MFHMDPSFIHKLLSTSTTSLHFLVPIHRTQLLLKMALESPPNSPTPASPDVSSDDESDETQQTLAQVIANRRAARDHKATNARRPSFFNTQSPTLTSTSTPTPTPTPTTTFTSTPTWTGGKNKNNHNNNNTNNNDNDRKIKEATASSKSRPRELPSNRPVPFGRPSFLQENYQQQQQRTVRRFDPRFEDHCGDLRELHVERNYEFLADQRERRRKQLEQTIQDNNKIKRKDEHQEQMIEHSKKELDRIKQNDVRRASILRQRQVEKQVKDEQKEAVRQGKQPFFLKKKQIRSLHFRAQFDDVKKSKGGVKKFIAKRRRKMVGKERKYMHTE